MHDLKLLEWRDRTTGSRYRVYGRDVADARNTLFERFPDADVGPRDACRVLQVRPITAAPRRKGLPLGARI